MPKRKMDPKRAKRLEYNKSYYQRTKDAQNAKRREQRRAAKVDGRSGSAGEGHAQVADGAIAYLLGTIQREADPKVLQLIADGLLHLVGTLPAFAAWEDPAAQREALRSYFRSHAHHLNMERRT